MKRYIIFSITIFTVLCSGFHLQVNALNSSDEKPSVLVLYSSNSGEIDEHQRMLDMLIGHFTSKITFKPITQVDHEELGMYTHVFYYGQIKDSLPESVQQLLETYTGVMVALGHNVEQLGERFSFVKPVSEEPFTKISLTSERDKSISVFPNMIINVETDSSTEILVKATYGPTIEYPLFIKSENTYYFAAERLEPPLSIFLGEVLHEVFAVEHEEEHPAYIRLEDVHPLVDPQHVMDIARELKKRDIPYMVAVVPVYTNPKTSEESFLSDSPQLLAALKYMQDHGGSVVLHGYTHQFRKTETGEGFEFWDVEYNMPIYHGPDDEVIKKTKDDFKTEVDFQNYLDKQLDFENEYIENKVTRGIQELSNYGIYPLAFEAPHYTMSQNGYQQLSQYFTTYVGQIQLSDDDWEIMSTAPYITEPSFLHGMQLLPETISYVQPNDPHAIEKMIHKANDYSVVRDGMVAGFYHPYLGVEGFRELMDELEQIPNLHWIDLKQMRNHVQVNHVDIGSDSGNLIVERDQLALFLTSFDYLFFHIEAIAKNATWILVGTGALAICLFIFYTLNTMMKYRKGKGHYG